MSKLNGLQPWLRPHAEYLVEIAAYNNLRPVVTSGYRSSAQQARLYQNFLAGRSRFPAAPPGRSLHEQRRAFDLVVTPRSMLPVLGRLWRSWGGQWFESDPIHFQA